jgi:hypothetical protein
MLSGGRLVSHYTQGFYNFGLSLFQVSRGMLNESDTRHLLSWNHSRQYDGCQLLVDRDHNGIPDSIQHIDYAATNPPQSLTGSPIDTSQPGSTSPSQASGAPAPSNTTPSPLTATTAPMAAGPGTPALSTPSPVAASAGTAAPSTLSPPTAKPV